MSKYSKEVEKSMQFLARNKEVIFLGQSVVYPGNLLYKTLTQVKEAKKIELPVFEEVQLGMRLGMAMNGLFQLLVFHDLILICAMNQLLIMQIK